MEPSESVDPVSEKLTVSGMVPVDGVAVATAVGALLVVDAAVTTTMGVLAELVSPFLSVKVRGIELVALNGKVSSQYMAVAPRASA